MATDEDYPIDLPILVIEAQIFVAVKKFPFLPNKLIPNINSFGIEQFTDIFTFHSYGKPGKVNPTILLHSEYLQFGAQTNNGNNFKIFYFVPNNENENVTINEKTWIKLDIRQYTQNYGKVK